MKNELSNSKFCPSEFPNQICEKKFHLVQIHGNVRVVKIKIKKFIIYFINLNYQTVFMRYAEICCNT